jgi:hypothetical protein
VVTSVLILGVRNVVILLAYHFYLQEENPSREHTILRTAQKLKPFSFNKFSANGYHDFLPSRLRPKFQNVSSDESTFSEILCLICGSPFKESELQNLESTRLRRKLSFILLIVVKAAVSRSYRLVQICLNTSFHYYRSFGLRK